MTPMGGWKQNRLAEVTNFISDGSHNPPKGIDKSDYLMLSSRDIQDGFIAIDRPRFLRKEDFENENRRTQLQKNDILLTSVGTIGRSAIYTGSPANVTFQRSVTVIRPMADKLNPKFLMYWLLSSKELLVRESRGVAQQGIYLNQIRDLVLPIPPLSKQTQIVEILDDHLSRLDAALADVRQAKEKTSAFRRSLLNAGMSGQFSTSQREPKTRFPKHWKRVTLAEVAKWTSGGTPTSSNPKFYNGEIPWVVIGDLTERVVSETTKKITRAGLEGSSAKILSEGTVMLAMYGASIGRTGVMAKPMSTNQAIACGTVNDEKILKEYLLYFLQSQKQDFIHAGKGGAQPNISQGVVKEWPIALPPLDEQEQIVSEIERQLSYLDSSSRMSEHIQKESANLRRSLFQSAFTGKLTKEEVDV
jgi:restriction endonuclease S subunit